jgi:hypothetical protein
VEDRRSSHRSALGDIDNGCIAHVDGDARALKETLTLGSYHLQQVVEDLVHDRGR